MLTKKEINLEVISLKQISKGKKIMLMIIPNSFFMNEKILKEFLLPEL